MHFQVKNEWKWLYALLLIIVVPNIIFWITAPFIIQERGIVVLEYLIIACLYPFIPCRLFKVIWVLFTLYDLFIATSSLFFMDFLEIAHALAKIPDVPFVSQLKWAGLLLLIVVIILVLLRLMIRHNASYPFLRFRFMWPFIVTGLLIVIFSTKENGNGFVSAPVVPFIKAVKHAIAKSREKHGIIHLGSVAKKVFNNTPDTILTTKEALILVEGWGLLNHQKLQQEVLQPLLTLAKNSHYVIKEGVSRYRFLTQAGEFRELTGYIFHYYQVQDDWVKQNSLLKQKQQQGYRIIGLHGNTSKFYRRYMIWPVLGVQDMFFLEDFNSMSMPLCGDAYFRGTCDTAINTWMFNNMQKQPRRKEFYYWVTLNTHLPIVEIHDESFRCFAEKWQAEKIPANVLQIAFQHRLLFAHLAARLSQPQAPRVHMLLTGDHAPPFIDPPSRRLYSETQVPYIELCPLQP